MHRSNQSTSGSATMATPPTSRQIIVGRGSLSGLVRHVMFSPRMLKLEQRILNKLPTNISKTMILDHCNWFSAIIRVIMGTSQYQINSTLCFACSKQKSAVYFQRSYVGCCQGCNSAECYGDGTKILTCYFQVVYRYKVLWIKVLWQRYCG